MISNLERKFFFQKWKLIFLIAGPLGFLSFAQVNSTNINECIQQCSIVENFIYKVYVELHLPLCKTSGKHSKLLVKYLNTRRVNLLVR